jgi:hypothetical protein
MAGFGAGDRALLSTTPFPDGSAHDDDAVK